MASCDFKLIWKGNIKSWTRKIKNLPILKKNGTTFFFHVNLMVLLVTSGRFFIFLVEYNKYKPIRITHQTSPSKKIPVSPAASSRTGPLGRRPSRSARQCWRGGKPKCLAGCSSLLTFSVSCPTVKQKELF